MQIRMYTPSDDYDNLMELIRSEGEEWAEYLSPAYKGALETSFTYVAYDDLTLCGYARSIDDSGFFVWVVDLLVGKDYRGRSIGEKLLKRILADFPGRDVFVMSDVDGYYHKLGYERRGSIFQVR